MFARLGINLSGAGDFRDERELELDLDRLHPLPGVEKGEVKWGEVYESRIWERTSGGKEERVFAAMSEGGNGIWRATKTRSPRVPGGGVV